MKESYFFPGGNTPGGFVNRFDDILPPDRAARLYCIKGGSGVGKSTFMRRIGERYAARGLDVEYFCCSSDPASLDGVALPALGVALMDGTAPHVMDPRLPGARDFTLNLGDFLDESRFEGRRDELTDAMRRRADCFARAYRYLAAAQPLYADAGMAAADGLRPAGELAGELSRWLTAAQGGSGMLRRLFAEAFSPDGLVSVLGTLPAELCLRVDVPWGCDASEALTQLAREHTASGGDAVLLMNPLRPDRALHLYLQDAGVLICADGGLADRRMRFDAAIDGGAGRMPDAEGSFDRRECMRLIGAATQQLARARALHAEVEEIYSSAMDFDAANGLLRRVTERIDTMLPDK